MKAEDLVWDIAYWNPTDEVTDEELQRFLDSGVGTPKNNSRCFNVRQFVEAFNQQEISDLGWLYYNDRRNDKGEQ
jgi:hypothetical protein